MAEQSPVGASMTTRRYRTDIGPGWWGALVVVTLALGFVGRDDGGFWSAFLWSVVGFVIGTLIAIAVSGRLVSARSQEQALADLDATTPKGVGR